MVCLFVKMLVKLYRGKIKYRTGKELQGFLKKVRTEISVMITILK